MPGAPTPTIAYALDHPEIGKAARAIVGRHAGKA